MDIAGALNAWQQRKLHRRRAVAERFGKHDLEPLRLRRAVVHVVSTDYVNRDDDGSYINPHLYRYPISVSHVELPA